jgi:hypothetical protein
MKVYFYGIATTPGALCPVVAEYAIEKERITGIEIDSTRTLTIIMPSSFHVIPSVRCVRLCCRAELSV